MQGYEVRAHDGERVGTVVDREGEYLIVEHGKLFKHRRGLHESFATADDDERVVHTTVSRELLESAPELDDGAFDAQATALHYGLAAGDEAPETLGYGDVAPDDPAWSAEQQEQRLGLESAAEQRARIRENL
jgi:hypothetical protein